MSVKKDFILPITVLSLICLVISGALAVVNNMTKPVIENAAAQRAAAARQEIIPHADSFELMEVEGLPRTVTQIFMAANGAGYIFMVSVPGYGGNMELICGIDIHGNIIKTAVLAHTETKGMTDQVFAQPHHDQYTGKNKNLENIIPVTGATISSNAYKNGVRDAYKAFELLRK